MSLIHQHMMFKLVSARPPKYKHSWDQTPRYAAVFRAMRNEGVLDRWCYRYLLQPLLARHSATAGMSCWDVVRMERILRRKDGSVRAVLDALKRPLDPTVGLLEISSTARVADTRAIGLEIDLSFGANGIHLLEFPLLGFRHLALVKVTNMELAAQSRIKSFEAKNRNDKKYWFNYELHLDEHVDEAIVPIDHIEARLGDRAPARPLLIRGPSLKAPSFAEVERQRQLAQAEKDLKALLELVEKMEQK